MDYIAMSTGVSRCGHRAKRRSRSSTNFTFMVSAPPRGQACPDHPPLPLEGQVPLATTVGIFFCFVGREGLVAGRGLRYACTLA